MATVHESEAPARAEGGAVAFFGRFKEQPRWALAIGLVNLLGIAYGFYYYTRQFGLTPAAYWPFVPDSPLAVLWAELALVAWWLLPRPRRGEDAPRWLDALDGLAWVGNAQVGVWTVYVLLVYAEAFGTLTLNLNTILLFGHAAMVALGAIFLVGLRRRVQARPARMWVALGAPLAYYLVNDALDYFGPSFNADTCGLRPITVPCDPALEPMLTAVTFGLTLASVAVLALVIRPKRTR